MSSAETMSDPCRLPPAPGGEMTDRVRRLRDGILAEKPGICLDRVRIYTRVHQEREDQPIIVRRALALKETLARMRIRLDDGELLAGCHASRPRAAPIFPEYSVSWILEELDDFERRPGDAFHLSGEDKSTLREILPWWKGKTLFDKGLALMTEELRDIYAAGLIHPDGILTCGDGHIAIYHEKLLEMGIGGYLREVDERLAGLDSRLAGDVGKRLFYQAVKTSLEGMALYIGRFADLAGKQAEAVASPGRKRELVRLAEACRRLTSEPAGSFFEALQMACFSQLILQIESNGHSLSLGRLDQYLFPYYRRDFLAGRLDGAEAVELLQCLWLKLMSVNKIRGWKHTRFSAGSPLYQNVTIGGQTPEGDDAVNALSYLILRSVGGARLPQPNLSVRYHKGLPEAFLLECLEVIGLGFGMPAFNNDEIVVPEFIRLGVEPADARDYAAIGCIETAVPGRWGYRCTGMSFLNFMRVLLAALANGRDPVSGKTFREGEGDFTDFTSFGQVMRAWERQAHFYARALVATDTAIDLAIEENVPDPLCSAFTDSCLERGLTIKEGGSKYDFISGLQVGVANLGNSLAAIKKLVFEDKLLAADELLRHLDSNFAGPEGERVRLLLLNRAPKFGNDDDYVDELTARAYGLFIDEYERHVTTRHGRGPVGCRYYAGTSSVSANVPQGATVPATPDGRKAWQPLAEGSSPASGTDRQGMTAVFKSIAKLPTRRILGGVLLNQKLSPSVLRTESDRRKLAGLLRSFFDDLKGWHVQYNIVDRETLLAAKREPEKYRDLVVRVAGYSAFFSVLAPDTQDDIIARTEQKL
ncbi:MAG: glycyl radical protein [Planctomycetota bacterium]|jgi:formate C-acetyltransferase|nr:glycyl radical protein [Planctomycetota bacterium]